MQEATIHNQTIVEQFSQQAAPFAAVPGHMDSMQMLIDLSRVSLAEDVLDVACGPGLVACAFAPHARHVTGIDITPRMIELAKQRQEEQQLRNLSWKIGDVLPLPFPSSCFHLVLTRFTFHHFLNPQAVLAEMVRVCKPGGKVMIVDVVQSPEKVLAYDRLEKLRDPSHVHALTFSEMHDLIAVSGLLNIRTARYKMEGEVERHLAASFPNPEDVERIRILFQSDLQLDRLGMDVHLQGDEIHFAFPILATVGEKPA